MKKITALILAIILCFTLAIPALGSEMSVNGQAYSINGIDVYKYPLKASQYFSVETIIYFVSDAAFAQVPVNDDVGVYLVTTMEEVTALASANPYAAIVIDANAEGLFDEELLVDLARTQHIILIRGFNAAAVSSYEEYASALKIERTSIHSQVFFSCIVDAVDRSIHAYNYLTQDNISMDDIFEFAEETKNDVFYIYDALVVQYDPELLSEIENADIPAANMVQETFSLEQQNEVATLNDWDTSANNRVKIFNSTFAYPNQKTLIIYQNATANSDRLMTCSAGEALLFTGTSVTVGDYAWDEVRGWKQSGSSVSLVKGWYLRSNTEDCLPIYSTGVHIANYCADASFDSTHKRVAFTLLASAKLYNSSGTVIKTLSKGDEVCFTIDDGYAGATRPYLISICGYTVFTNNLGYYTAVTSTTFDDLNFDCGYTGGYRVVTEIDWS